MIFNVKSSSESIMAETVKYGDSNVAQELSNLSDTVSSSVRMEIQSYTGTGLYGEANPCVLTFSFIPKVIMFVGAIANGVWVGMEGISANSTNVIIHVDKVMPDTLATSYANYNGFYTNNAFSTAYIKKSEDSKSVMWYNTEKAEYQLNSKSYVYYFMALG